MTRQATTTISPREASPGPRRGPSAASPRGRVRYRRLHGLGNDYVFVHHADLRDREPSEVARVVSDRHRGVGGDGLISIETCVADATAGDGAWIRMRMWNADGSPGGMCGNGVRGAVRFAIEEALIEPRDGRCVVEIGRRRVPCRVLEPEPKFLVSVDMGAASLAWDEVPFRPISALPEPESPVLRSPAELASLGIARFDEVRQALVEACSGWAVASMGNPHLVLLSPTDTGFGSTPLAAIGPLLERAVAFPQRTNVHLVRVEHRRRFRMRTWERGTGATLACGSGACAAFAILQRTGAIEESAIAVLEGGDLALSRLQSGSIEMTGPTESCCEGGMDLDELIAAAGRRSAGTFAIPVDIDAVEQGTP